MLHSRSCVYVCWRRRQQHCLHSTSNDFSLHINYFNKNNKIIWWRTVASCLVARFSSRGCVLRCNNTHPNLFCISQTCIPESGFVFVCSTHAGDPDSKHWTKHLNTTHIIVNTTVANKHSLNICIGNIFQLNVCKTFEMRLAIHIIMWIH